MSTEVTMVICPLCRQETRPSESNAIIQRYPGRPEDFDHLELTCQGCSATLCSWSRKLLNVARQCGYPNVASSFPDPVDIDGWLEHRANHPLSNSSEKQLAQLAKELDACNSGQDMIDQLERSQPDPAITATKACGCPRCPPLLLSPAPVGTTPLSNF